VTMLQPASNNVPAEVESRQFCLHFTFPSLTLAQFQKVRRCRRRRDASGALMIGCCPEQIRAYFDGALRISLVALSSTVDRVTRHVRLDELCGCATELVE
jgi:hypothetical protein